MKHREENKVLDIIIELAKAIQETKEPDEKNCQYYLDDGTNRLWGAKYLLGQILRQYRIKNSHIFISVAADKLWKEITDGKEKIENYHYTMSVPVYKKCKLALYKGASQHSEEKTFTENSKFQYRQVFHDEHVIPIADIIEKLIALDDLNYENVQNILNNIYMCRMLKSENIGLSHKGRPWSVVDTIKTIYREKNIEIVDWTEKEKSIIPNLVQ